MSPSRPAVTTRTLITSRYPFRTHWTLSAEACSSRSMVGSASATTVESSIRMKRPRQVPTKTHHCLPESPRLTSGGGQLEDVHRARAAYEPARRDCTTQVDHPSLRV